MKERKKERKKIDEWGWKSWLRNKFRKERKKERMKEKKEIYMKERKKERKLMSEDESHD